MLHLRRGFGDEKSQLRELNSRLDQYLSRVRQLEGENQLLVEEIHRLRLERGAEWSQGYHAEVCQLRRKVEELSVQKCEAELQRENVWQELQTLQELWDQVRAMRLVIEEQLALYKKDLQQAQSGQASLEELLFRLHQECEMLQGSQQEELVALRQRALQMPAHIAMQGAVAPSLSLQDFQSFSLELSDSWTDTLMVYQKKIEEFEGSLRLSMESRQGAEEEARGQLLLVQELHREYEELLGIRKRLEEELLRMKEKYNLKVEEYQGENYKYDVILSDRPTRNIPAGFVKSAGEQTRGYSGVRRGETRQVFPVTRRIEDKRRKEHTSNINRFNPRPITHTQVRSQSEDTGRTNSFYLSHVREKTAHDKSERFDTSYPPRYGLLKNNDIPQNRFPTEPATVGRPFPARESRVVTPKIKQEQVRHLKPVNAQRAQAEEITGGEVDIRVEYKTKETNSVRGLDTKEVEQRTVGAKYIEEERSVLESTVQNMLTDKKSRKEEEAECVTETVGKDTSKETKIQEPPVKKERKKREQAKKNKDETEETPGEKTIGREEKMDAYESVYGVKNIVLEETPLDDQVGREIPIIFEVSKKSSSPQRNGVENTWESSITRSSNQSRVNDEASSLGHVEASAPKQEAEWNESSDTGDYQVVITPSEHLAERAMAADILKHFGQPSALDDANVTYVERNQQDADGSVKTEIIVQSKTEEDTEFYNEAYIADLWNRRSSQTAQEEVTGATESLVEDLLSTNVTQSILKDVQGAEGEDWIQKLIHAGLKGRPGMSVKVEIIEESIGSFEEDRPEFTTPFQVEEAEEHYSGADVVNTEEEDLHVSMTGKDLQSKMQSSERASHVEEVTEGEDVDEETSYFVSIPDDNHSVPDEEEETLRGQIHIEEESHVKYSWQDEFLEGSQNRKMLSDFVKYASTNDPETTVHGTLEDTSIYRLEEQEPKGDLDVGAVVIEKEIKIPHEFQSSIRGLLSKDVKDPQQQLKEALECLQGSIPQDLMEELSTLAREEQAHSSSLAVDIKKVDQTKDSGMVTIVAEINVSQTMDRDNLDALKFKERASSLHSAEDLSEAVTSFLDSKERDTSVLRNNYGVSQESYNSFTLETNNGAECYTSEETIHKDPPTRIVQLSPTAELSQTQISSDVSRFIKHIKLGTSENISQEGSISDTKEHDSFGELSPTDINRSVHHIRLGQREIYSTEQIIYEGPISETLQLDVVKNTEDSTDQNRSIRHIKINPTEMYPAEQIIFHGPIFKTLGSVAAGDNISQAAQDIKSGLEDMQTGEQDNGSHGVYQAEAVAGASKTTTHFKLNTGETQATKEIIFEGPISKILELSRVIPLENSEEDSRPIEHKSSSQKIHVAKQIKYQGLISESFQLEDPGSLVEREDQPDVNTFVHHIKLGPNKEQIVFQGPISANRHVGADEDNSHLEEMSDTNRSVTHIRLGAKEMNTSERIIFEGPISETYISSDVRVESSDGDETESERSIKHIKLSPTEKSFTFQMDITKVATKFPGEGVTQENTMVISSGNFEEQPEMSQLCNELTDDQEVTESGYGEEEIAGVSQYPCEVEVQSPGQRSIDTSEFEKTVQLQRIVDHRSVIADDKKVAIVYLEQEEEPDQDYLRRSF
ncbi:hypothetical protein FKM82_030143 [Ascaphus truei]